MRICIAYDCIFPFTIGGAERWYRNLAERLAAAGHDVTYLTLQQWPDSDVPEIAGVRLVSVGPQMPLYNDGKRRIWPPIRYGIGVFWHLLRYGRRYDWLHTASFPYFSLIAAGIVRPFARYRIAVDWHEFWSREYWREYLGRLSRIGWTVQSLCARVPQVAYSFSRLHGRRVEAASGGQPVTLLNGEYAGGDHGHREVADNPPTIVYAGRLIAEKRVTLLIEALSLLMPDDHRLRCAIYGQGPEWESLKSRVAELGLSDRIALLGFVSAEDLETAMIGASVIVQPSMREGYGMVVVEAAARGVPVAVVAGEDNASVELIDEGRNGFIAKQPDAAHLAEAIGACLAAGPSLRASTRDWYAENQERLSLDHSLEVVMSNYALGFRQP